MLRESDVRKLIERAIRKAYLNETGLKDLTINEIHVTEAVQCLRKSYYYRKARVEVPLEKTTVLLLGSITHKAIQKYIEGKRIETEKELRYPFKEFVIVGRVDLIVDGIIIEIKTTSSKPRSVYEHHYMQLNAYINMLNELYPNRYNEYGYIVYINKRDGSINVFTVFKDVNMWLRLIARACKLRSYLIKNELPEPEPSFLCRYCEYRFMCNLNDKVEGD